MNRRIKAIDGDVRRSAKLGAPITRQLGGPRKALRNGSAEKVGAAAVRNQDKNGVYGSGNKISSERPRSKGGV
jgi:hypothetical protein